MIMMLTPSADADGVTFYDRIFGFKGDIKWLLTE